MLTLDPTKLRVRSGSFNSNFYRTSARASVRRRGGWHRWIGTLSVYLLAAPGVPGAQPWPQAELQLEEIASIGLDPATQVLGGALSPTGAIIYWARSPARVTKYMAGELRDLCPEWISKPIAAAFTEHDSVVEIVDADGGRIVRSVGTHSCEVRQRFAVPGVPVVAAYSGAIWFVGTVDSVGASDLWTITGSGVVSRLTDAGGELRKRLQMRATFLSPHRCGVILSSLRWPFGWRLFDSEGSYGRERRPFADHQEFAPGNDSLSVTSLVGLATHAIGDEYLQILADPKSDSRVIVLYDEDGDVLRRTRIDVSLGVLHSVPAVRSLLALRRTDRLELVEYRWRWQPAKRSGT